MDDPKNWMDLLKELAKKLTAPGALVVILVVVIALLGNQIQPQFSTLVYILAIGGFVLYAVLEIVRLLPILPPPPHPDNDLEKRKMFDQIIQTYLEWVCSKYGEIDWKGIKKKDVQVMKLPLDEIYIPLEADFIRTEREQKELTPEERERSISMSQVCRLGERLVVTGGPGSGKSTVLCYIAFWLAKAILDNDPGKARERIGMDEKVIPVPIVIPLGAFNQFRKKNSQETDPDKKTLWHFIVCYLKERQLTGIPDDFFVLLEGAGREVILLLDGLDEVPSETDRKGMTATIEDLAKAKPAMKMVVTCRSVAYLGESVLAGFREVRVRPLEPETIQSLIHKAYDCIFKIDKTEAEKQEDDLVQGVKKLEQDRQARSGDSEPLVTSPLMVRMLLIVHYSDQKLPNQRAELYKKVIEALLEPVQALDEDVKQELANAVGGSMELHRDMLQLLAFEMHQQGEKQGREISEGDLKRVLEKEAEYCAHIPALLAYTTARGSVLKKDETFSFIHLGFQEFLAGRYLAEVLRNQGIESIASFLEKGPVLETWWREAAMLCIGYLSIDAGKAARDLVKRLAGLDDGAAKRKTAPDVRLAALELAASGLMDFKTPNPDLQDAVKAQLAKHWIAEENLVKTPALIRARAGSTLARLGDDRFDPELYYLPREELLGFVPIPAGMFWMGSDKEKDADTLEERESPIHQVNLPLFYLNRFPVTVAQFKAFVDADKEKHIPLDLDSLKGVPNHPVIYISWYVMLQYCQWLDQVLRQNSATPTQLRTLLENEWEVTLPSEAEWEKGARGMDGRIYPYLGPFDPQKANVDETGIGGTSPVGCFPGGASPYELQDMSGNVWEWTRSLWGTDWQKPEFGYPYDPQDAQRENLKAPREMLRVLRGGSWGNYRRDSRCAFRYRNFPANWLTDNGFRLSLSKTPRS